MKIKIKSEFIHSILSIVISLTILFFPIILGKKIMWINYTDCNELTTVGYVATWLWLAVLYGFIVNGVYYFLKRYTDYDND